MSDTSQLEKEFKALVKSVGNEINAKVKQAEQLLTEACNLADKHGIPFDSGISHLGQVYVPESFKTRFGTLDKEDAAELLGVYEDDLDHSRGWRHSQVGC